MGSPRARIVRELRTLEAMVDLACADLHAPQEERCPACDELVAYAGRRLERCPYGEEKPTCVNCPIHCYRPSMRERARDVMRHAGPRMLLRHPILAIRHVLDGRHKAPELPNRRAVPAPSPFAAGP